MGFADGFYYGQGKIIVDTTNLLATDVVRVRSMTTPTKVWNKTVTTPGDYMVFEVPGKDYYKISLVQEQEISGETVEVEIVNLFRTIDYGQTITANVFDKTTLRGIQAILNSHNEAEVLNIGDEVTIKYNNADWTMKIAAIDLYNDHEVLLVSKRISESCQINTATAYYMTYPSTILKQKLESFYQAVSNEDKQFIKEVERYSGNYGTGYTKYSAYVWSPSHKELTGNNCNAGTPPNTQLLFPLYTTADGRIVYTNNGQSVSSWWYSDGRGDLNSGNGWGFVNSSGAVTGQTVTSSAGVCPCFSLIADS